MSNFSNKFSTDGYFRNNSENHFPFEDRGQHVWYSLFTSENGEVKEYGFKSTFKGKRNLMKALNNIEKVDDAQLIGIWNGKWSTHLFKLNIEIAMEKISESLV